MGIIIQTMEQYISGVIKDISFHELFMKTFRTQNIKSNLFDIQLAYYMLDSSRDTLINSFEIQGFLDKHSYQHEEYICQYVVSCLDKSAVGLTFQKFTDLMIQGSQDQKLLACHRNSKPKLSSADYQFWDKVKADTLLRVLNILNKQAIFYTKLEDRKRIFCKYWSGDVYKALSFWNHKESLSCNDIYQFLKSKGVLFNQNEWKALVSRTTSCSNNEYPKEINKQELIDCLVTSKFKKKAQSSKQLNIQIDKSVKSYTKWLDQEYVLARKHRLNAPKIKIQPQLLPISELSYKFQYPQAQMHSVSNLYLLEQKNKQLVRDKLNLLDKDKRPFRNYLYERSFNPLLDKPASNPFASNKYYY